MDVDVKAKFPHIAPAIDAVAALVERMRGSTAPLELEARIGTLEARVGTSHYKFVSGDPRHDSPFLSNALCFLDECTGAFSTGPWTQQIDRFYRLPDTTLQVRTSTELAPVSDKSGGTVSHKCVVTHMIKTNVAHVDLAWRVPAMDSSCVPDPPNVRVSLKQEDPVSEADLPARVDTVDVVRIKQRRTFTCASRLCPDAKWNVDVTLVYQALSETDALEALRAGAPTSHELEVECRNPDAHLRSANGSAHFVAASLLLKMADMFQSPDGPSLADGGCRLEPCGSGAGGAASGSVPAV